MKKIFFLSFILLFSVSIFAQAIQLSPQAEISVITCGPGHEELYEVFGHSAIRIQDKKLGLDRVYNYGTFNFNTPNFYTKFARGKLLYELRAYDFGIFLRSYQRENRWIKGQILNLTLSDKQNIYHYLENNAKPENRAYKYDFFYDNCSTKIYEVLKTVLGDKMIFDSDFTFNNYSHRNLISLYAKGKPWGNFGIDLALGSDIDKKMTSKEYMFLPDYVLAAISDTKIKTNQGNIPIVKRTDKILLQQGVKEVRNTWTPTLVFGILAVLVIFLTYRDYKKGTRNKILDFIIFFTTGLIGIVLLLLWFATDHTATIKNYNILWAFAPNLIFAFVLLKNKWGKWYQHYALLLLILLDVLVLMWLFKYQIFSVGTIPILILLYTRYIYLWMFFKKKNLIIN